MYTTSIPGVYICNVYTTHMCMYAMYIQPMYIQPIYVYNFYTIEGVLEITQHGNIEKYVNILPSHNSLSITLSMILLAPYLCFLEINQNANREKCVNTTLSIYYSL